MSQSNNQTGKLSKTQAARIARQIEKHLKIQERAKALYRKSGEVLDMLIARGVPFDTPFVLSDGTQMMVRDQFAGGVNVAFKQAMVPRYKIMPVPRTMRPKPADDRRGAEAQSAEREVAA